MWYNHFERTIFLILGYFDYLSSNAGTIFGALKKNKRLLIISTIINSFIINVCLYVQPKSILIKI